MIVRLGQICSNGIVTLVILYFIVVVCRANSIEIEQFDGTIFRQFWYPRSIIPFFFFFFSLKYSSTNFCRRNTVTFFFLSSSSSRGKPSSERNYVAHKSWKYPGHRTRSSHHPIKLLYSDYSYQFLSFFFFFCDETINSPAVKQRFVKRLKREKWMKVEGKLACRSWERLVTLKLA